METLQEELMQGTISMYDVTCCLLAYGD